ncbi:RICIN domain-containing protein [Dactylosporangium sp. NPDC049742]|uniref:RICIN domain-containing protein n=1 Tax=Dactylosporangium sp. NPDC049742 TaxID=3154737 RepID=UPI0034232E45
MTVDRAAAKPPCPAVMASLSAAEATARNCAGPVEALDRRTVDSRTLIAGDGTATVEHHVAPRWVRRADGGWADIDTTLRFVDGAVAPAATLVPVTFSAKGTGPLATLSLDGRRIAMSWPGGRLPVPVLSGATATYEDVLPGVDLRMTALADGFSEVLVVESPQAAANPALAKLAFGLEATGVTLGVSEDGGVHAKDGKGQVVFTSPRALMWDSAADGTGDAVTAKSAKAPTGGHGAPRIKTMGESLSGGKLTITPDKAFLTDPATRYPVYIDPTFTGGKSGNAWAVVASRSDLAGSKFWQTTFMSNSGTYGDAGSGLTCDNFTGNTCTSTTYKVRSLFRMETYGAAGATVISSNFEITQKWSWTCNTASDAKLWVIGGFDSNTTWNNQPSWDGAHTSTTPGNRAVGSANGCQAPGTVSFDATGMVQWGFSQGWSVLNLGLQALSEGTNQQWKRFDSSTATLKIRYDHAPTTPALSDLKVGPNGFTSCGPSAGTATRVNTTNGLTLNAVLSDVDAPAGDLVKAEWAVTGVAAQYAPAPETAGLTSGSNHQTTIPAAAFTNGAAISWQARGVDTDNDAAGGWSPACHLLVDNTAPSPPGVTSTDLALRVGVGIVPAPKPTTAVVGRSATVTFAADAADVGSIVGFRYGVSADMDATPTIWVAAAADGTAQAAVVPLDAVFYNSVVVTAVKADGTAGASTSARFRVAAATGTPHVLGDATGDGRADVTLLSDVGGGKSALWRWDATAAGTGAFNAPVAPQGNAGIYTTATTLSATGDFDGNGQSDVATLAPAGSDVTVTVQQSDANQLLSTPVLRTMTGWTLSRIKAVGGGDVNADGKADLTVAYDNGNVSWTLFVLLSTSTPGSVSFAAPADWYHFPVGGSDPSKVKLVFGDFNGDGRSDVGQFYDYGNVHTKLWMHWSQTNNTYTESTLTWDSGVGGWGSQASKYVAGDFTGDGKTDIVSFYFPGGVLNGTLGMSTFVAKADGTGINAPTTTWTSPANTWDWTVTEPQPGDFNGDGKADIALTYGCCGPYQRSLYTLTSTGPSFGAPALRWQGGIGPLSGGSLALDTTGTVRYQLVNVNSGKCLQITGASTTSGAWAQQSTCNATATHQLFTAERVGAVNTYLHPVHAPGQCLAVPGGYTTDNAGIGQWACNTAPDQFQQLDYVAGTGQNTMVRIRPTHSNKCVAIPNGSLAEGTGAIQWTCGAYADQTWYLRIVP